MLKSQCGWCHKIVPYEQTTLIQNRAGLLCAICNDCAKAELKKGKKNSA